MKKILPIVFISLLFILIDSCSKEDIKVYELTTSASPAEGGSVSPSSGSFVSGEEVSITAKASSGYVFKNWSGSITGTTNPIKMNMNSDKEVIAVFEMPDADNDGVTDSLDQCPDTSSGESVDENGCSDSQKDSDNDGVPDDIDQCPNTPLGETVDVLGCTVIGISSVTFAALGDFGSDSSDEENVANLIANLAPEIIITAGDNRYGSLSMDLAIGQFYCDYLDNVGIDANCSGGNSPTNRFFPSAGNHEYTDGGGINEYLNYFDLPGNNIPSSNTSGSELFYDFIVGPVHFFTVDSQATLSNSTQESIQKNWLQSQLSASTSPWKIVFFHHAPYSSSSTHGSNPNMQWPFATWGADAVITGHDHTYERLELDGIPYFVNGLGGRSIYSFGTPVIGSQVRYNAEYGAMYGTATETLMTFQFINILGEIIDTYTIQ
jgi:hypothetical protein